MGGLVVSLLIASAAPPTEGQGFAEVVARKARPGEVALLYVVLRLPGPKPKDLDQGVLRYARAALREAESRKWKGNVVFFFSLGTRDRAGLNTGFTLEQLREYLALPRGRALERVGRHTWALGFLPDPDTDP
jgi:hypothetical protein